MAPRSAPPRTPARPPAPGPARRALFAVAVAMGVLVGAEVALWVVPGVAPAPDPAAVADPRVPGWLRAWGPYDARAFLFAARAGGLRPGPGSDLSESYVPDPVLRVRLRPGLTWSGPFALAPPDAAVLFHWNVRTGAAGHRGPDPGPLLPGGPARVACLGDSSTFGWGVPQDSTYPVHLRAALTARDPARAWEAINLGVPSYSSFQGAVVLDEVAAALAPEVVVLSFGTNDGHRSSLSDADYAADRAADPAAGADVAGARGRRGWPGRSRLVAALRSWLGQRAPAPSATGVLRVAPDAYESNLAGMIERTRALGARPVLLETSGCIEAPYAEVMERLAGALAVPLVRTETVFAEWLAGPGPATDGRARLLAAVHGARTVEEHPELLVTVGDGCHPNRIGTRLVARALAEVILPLDPPPGPDRR